MHIVILYQYYLRPGEPGHSRVNEYARKWVESGHQVSVITGQTSYMTGRKEKEYHHKFCAQEKDAKVDVYRCFVPDDANRSFLRRAYAYLAFAFSSAVVFKRLKSPTVLLASSPPLTIGMPALLVCKLTRIPMVFEVRDLWPESAVSTGVLTSKPMIRFLSWLEKKCYQQAKCLNVMTTAFRDNIAKRGLKEASLIHNVQAGVDVDDMNPKQYSDAIRSELGWGDKKVVLYTGAIGRANRVAQLVDTARLLKNHPEILIAIVGAGMEESALKERVEREQLSNIVFHGSRPKEAMPAIIASADICTAVLMKSDTFKTVYPNKVFDYMACERPVIVAIDGMIRSLLEEQDAGVFVEPENPRSIADGILSLVSDDQRCRQLGQNGRRFVVEEFDRRVMAKKYEEILTSISD